MSVGAPSRAWPHRHLLDVDELSREEIVRVLDLADEMRDARETRAHRTLLDLDTVALAFYEPSTRTRVSFELAAKALGATVVDLAVERSSAGKGESLVDTLRTLRRVGATIVVLRHAASGAPYLAARETDLGIVNAGDGTHAHPTQALLDALTLREALGGLEGRLIAIVGDVTHAHPTQALLDALTLREALGGLDGRLVAIVGDVTHSRVARSNAHALTALGARVRVGGPAAWVAGFDAWPGVEVATTLERALDGADAVMTLRVQAERGAVGGVGSLADYVRDWRLDEERMALAAPGAPLLHPGPTNEGVELTADLANGRRSLIGRQVEHGVTVRMAVLALVAGLA